MYIILVHAHAGITGDELCKYSRLKPSQISLLKAVFTKNYLASKCTMMHLAQKTGLSQFQIHDWFRIRRELIRHGKIKGKLPTGMSTCACTCIYKQ